MPDCRTNCEPVYSQEQRRVKEEKAVQKNVMSARGRTILYAVLILFAVIQVYPIIWVILQSIKTTEELTNLSALSLPSSLYRCV